MSQRTATAPAASGRRLEYLAGLGLFVLIAVVGLYIVKWSPYWGRAFTVAGSHTLGNPIIYGAEAAPPAASLAAAFDYAQRYFLAVWQAMLVGLLMAATIETVVPRDWLVHLLGSRTARTSVLGGVLALPGMM